jgi:BTB/POZ domain
MLDELRQNGHDTCAIVAEIAVYDEPEINQVKTLGTSTTAIATPDSSSQTGATTIASYVPAMNSDLRTDLLTLLLRCNPGAFLAISRVGLEEREPDVGLTDITLVAGSPVMVDIRCHKSILASRSPVLRQKMTKAGFEMKLFFGQGKLSLTIPNVPNACLADTVSDLILFIYTDTVSDDALLIRSRNLLRAAVKYEVKSLVALCENYITEMVLPAEGDLSSHSAIFRLITLLPYSM